MKRLPIRRAALALALASSLPAAARADEVASNPAGRAGLVHRATRGRLSLGLRLSRLWLEDSRRYGPNGLDNGNGPINFLGSLWGLDPVQRYVPSPFLEYRIVSGVGVGVAYDEARIRTLDWANAEKTVTAGDGDLRLRGAQIWGFASYPRGARITLGAYGGYGRYWPAFFEAPGWALPGRWFEVHATQGWLAGARLRVTPRRHLGIEVGYEHLGLADVPAKAHLLGGGHKNGVFPARSDALRAGLVYTF